MFNKSSASGTSEGRINRGIVDISAFRQPETPIKEDIALDWKQDDKDDSDRKYPTIFNLGFVYQNKQNKEQETRNKKHAPSAFTTAKLRYLIAAKDISRVWEDKVSSS